MYQVNFSMESNIIVDSFSNDGVNIHYEHEGSGDTPISAEILEKLFHIRSEHKSEKRVELCERYMIIITIPCTFPHYNCRNCQ